uniref:Sulfotransferase n=1 Tax=Myripristis murdjan TaxID=586833 RepID=A0A667Y709_9TELE
MVFSHDSPWPAFTLTARQGKQIVSFPDKLPPVFLFCQFMSDTFCWFPNHKIQSFQVRPDDIVIATYPEAGTTWVSFILDLLYFGQTSPERQTSMPIHITVPFLELDIPSLLLSGTDLADKLPTSPQLIKTHLPVQLVPKSIWEQNCRVQYVFLPLNNVVSFFHFDRMNKVEPEPGDWNSYLQRFMDRKMVFGSWYDHVTGWWEKKQTHSKIHYMFYEDLIEVNVQLGTISHRNTYIPSAHHNKSVVFKHQNPMESINTQYYNIGYTRAINIIEKYTVYTP